MDDSFDCVTDNEMVEISMVQQQVKYMRSRKRTKQGESSSVRRQDKTDDDLYLSSGSDYQLNEDEINSSDSEWSSGDDDVLKIRKRAGDSSSDDDSNVPLICFTKTGVNQTSLEKPCYPSTSTAPQPVVTPAVEELNTSLSLEQPVLPESGDDSSDVDAASSLCVTDTASASLPASTSTEGRGKKRIIPEKNRKAQKKRRDQGLSFMDRSGVERDAKAMRLGCGLRCSKKCHENFKDCDRQAIFQNFWQLGDTMAQRLFVANSIEKKSTERTYVKYASRRQQTFVYKLAKEGAKHIVCKKFFLDTLAIKEDFVYSALKSRSTDSKGDDVSDKRGKHGHQKKTPERAMAFIKKHIGSFQPIESHYCRKSSARMYLPETLTLEEMYRLYCRECDQNNEEKVSKSLYKRVFYTDFNLAFYKPKKDQCDLCLAIKNNPSTIAEEQMREHLTQKQLAREVKESFKSEALQDPSVSAACFDLQKVLECPHGEASSYYYSRKLAVYNFTIFEMDTSDGFCYMWPEHVAKRGANEISTCVFDFLCKKAEEGKKKVYTFSDNCGGQNRNRGIASMMWFIIQTTDLEEVTHTYLEKGHTQNENDSIHSVIERSARHNTIYTPEQWYGLVRTARKNKQKYNVKEMALGDIQDFMGMAQKIKNFKIDMDGNNVNWTRIRQISVKKSSPNMLNIKYDLGGEFKIVDLFRKQRRSDSENQITPGRITSRPGIAQQKKDDLIRLCDAHLIPRVYHDFFHALPVSTTDLEDD